MSKKIEVSERVSEFGQQVFVFALPNGRTLELEFCAGIAGPEYGLCAAVASLHDEAGAKIPISVDDPDQEEAIVMKRPALRFATEEEEAVQDRVLSEVFNSIKEELGPLVKEIDSFKNN